MDPEPVICSSGWAPGGGMEAGEKMGFSCEGKPMRCLGVPGRATLALLVSKIQLCS